MTDKIMDKDAVTIFEIVRFVFAPCEELFALVLSVTGDAMKVEGDALLGGDYLLYGTCNAVEGDV